MNFPTIFCMDKRFFPLLFRWVAGYALLLFLSVSLSAQSGKSAFPPKPEPAVYVHDYSGWLRADQKIALENKLRRYWDSTSTQIVVMIRPDLGDYDRATYAIELGNRWGVGKKGKDNGVVVLIKSEAPDRGVFIATGYGVEGGLTDLQSGRIIRNTMSPFFRDKRYYEGINAGLDEIITALSGEFTRDPDDEGDGAIAGLILLLVLALFIIFIVILVRRMRKGGDWYTRNGGPDERPYSRRYRDNSGGGWWIGGGGGGWGGGSSGGGFDGGSFGGGSFGGGGAGGDW